MTWHKSSLDKEDLNLWINDNTCTFFLTTFKLPLSYLLKSLHSLNALVLWIAPCNFYYKQEVTFQLWFWSMPTVDIISTFNTKNKKQNDKQGHFGRGEGRDENLFFLTLSFSRATGPTFTKHETSILEF